MSETERGELVLPGERLRSGREALGLSQADISARMHLSVAYIRALETGDYKRLPDAAFVRGYIKNYARLVNLPPDELVGLFQQINQDARAEEAAPLPPRVAAPDRRLWWVGGVIGFAIAIWLFWPASVDAPTPQSKDSTFIEAEVSLEEYDGMYEDPLQESGAQPAADAQRAADESPAAGVASSAVMTDRLVVNFSEACWLRVRDANGDELYVGQRDAGQALDLQGKGPFRLTLGNAAAVSAISFNGAGVRVPQAAPGQVITVRAP